MEWDDIPIGILLMDSSEIWFKTSAAVDYLVVDDDFEVIYQGKFDGGIAGDRAYPSWLILPA